MNSDKLTEVRMTWFEVNFENRSIFEKVLSIKATRKYN